jgi:phosphate transport system permease protein
MTDITEEIVVVEAAEMPSPNGPSWPRRARPRRPRRRLSSGVVQIVLAVSAALAVMVAVSVVGNWRQPLAVVVAGYATFVVVIFVSEILRERTRQRTTVIDLVAAEPPTIPLPVVVDPRPAARAYTLPDDPRDDKPRARRRLRADDIVIAVFAALAATAFAEVVRVVYKQESYIGTALWWYVAFIAVFALLARDRSDAETALDRVVTVIIWSVGLLVAAVLAWMLMFLFAQGIKRLSWSFFTEDLSEVGPLNPGGGAKHAVLGTLVQVGIATLIVVPIAVLTAVYLHEVNGRLARPVRFIVDAMAGLPSIVAGLLVFTIWVDGRGFSGISGSAALVVLMLPTVTRTSEEILRTIPDPLREGALALGAPQWRVVRKVVLPTALAGLVTAAILGVARAIGETAPMLLTAFGTESTNVNPLEGPQSDLPLFVWKLIRQPDATQNERGWTGLFVLVLMVLVLFVAARFIASRGQRKLGRAR